VSLVLIGRYIEFCRDELRFRFLDTRCETAAYFPVLEVKVENIRPNEDILFFFLVMKDKEEDE